MPKAEQAQSYARLIDAVNGTTADDLVRYALEHNGELAAARAAIAEARGRLRQAGLKPNPMIEAGGSKAANAADNSVMIGVEWPLELGGRRQARMSVADRELEMREAEVADFERRLAAEVRMKYSEAIAAARDLSFTEELLRLTRDSHQLIRARVEHGKSAPIEQSLFAVEVNRADAARIGFDSKAEVAFLELKKAVGMPPEEPLRLRGEFALDRQPVPRAEAMRLAVESRPDIVALRAAENLAEAQINAARIDDKADASIFGGYERMNFGFGVRGFNSAGALAPVMGIFHNVSFGVRLTLPTRNKNQGNIEAAVAASDAAGHRREFAELAARNEIAAAFVRLERAETALAVYRDSVRETSLRNLDIIRQAYLLGQKTALDVIAEQRRYVEIETGYTQSLKGLLDAQIEVERATGLPAMPAEQKIKTEVRRAR